MINLESPEFFADRYRRYLRFIAQLHLGAGLQAKLDPSDLVQETFIKAYEARHTFRGKSEAEWQAFLRRILHNVMADQIRHFTRDKRDIHQEEMLEKTLEESARRIEYLLAGSTLEKQKEKEEMLMRLSEAMNELTSDERRALELRYLRNPSVPLDEIATELARPSSKAVAGLLGRSLKKLRTILNAWQ